MQPQQFGIAWRFQQSALDGAARAAPVAKQPSGLRKLRERTGVVFTGRNRLQQIVGSDCGVVGAKRERAYPKRAAGTHGTRRFGAPSMIGTGPGSPPAR